MLTQQRRLTSAIVVSILLCVVPAALGTEEDPPSGWLQLDLVRTTMAGTTVYYEKALEPNLPVFERHFESFVDERAGAPDLVSRREEIIADINGILGAVDANSSEQCEMLERLVGVLFEVEPTFYLIRTSTIKAFLQAGGELPDCTYDRAADKVMYNPQLHWNSGENPPTEIDCCVPVRSDVEFGEYVSTVLDAFLDLLGSRTTAEIAIHEVTEVTLLRRARPSDPYWRWFSDGFANAITYRLTEKYWGSDAAREFASAYDLAGYRDLESEINLAYWMMADFSAYANNPPVEKEDRILYARYAFSMDEARRLIDEHGIECVREILDKIAAKDSRKGSDLLEVIEEVTGADMVPRLAHYQTFATREEGIPKYGTDFQEAEKRQDWEAMFVDIMRIMELRGDVFSTNYLVSFQNAALLLFRMGKEAAGDQVMRNAIELYSESPVEYGREVAMEAFLNYAIQCGHPSKALNEADELLKAAPNTTAALTVKMMVAAQRRNLPEAQELAERILQRTGERSLNHRLATEVLAIDPNTLSQTP